MTLSWPLKYELDAPVFSGFDAAVFSGFDAPVGVEVLGEWLKGFRLCVELSAGDVLVIVRPRRFRTTSGDSSFLSYRTSAVCRQDLADIGVLSKGSLAEGAMGSCYYRVGSRVCYAALVRVPNFPTESAPKDLPGVVHNGRQAE